MTRFFVSPQEIGADFFVLTGDHATHAKVLRLRAGEKVIVCDGQGREWLCTISDISAEQVCLVVDSSNESDSEASIKVGVYMAFSKGDKFEHVIQKATELGAYEIIGFPSSRCVSKPDQKNLKNKVERWQKIAAAAAQQSGRGRVPEISVVDSYDAALIRATKADKAILFYENERSTTLKMALQAKPYHSISLLSGPEGGLESREVEQASQMGLEICTLGKRILRCETAPLCALSAVMYEAGEF